MLRIFVTGTGTDVGKTVITTLLTDFLSNEENRIFPYKPIQTGASIVQGDLHVPDPNMYKYVFQFNERTEHYTYALQTPCSPHLAAKLENVTFDINKIKQHIEKIEKNYEGIIVEGAGGLYVPITDNGYCVIDLMKDLLYPVILVARAEVGTINHTVLAIKAMQAKNIPIIGVILNGTGQEDRDIEEYNIHTITQLTNVPIIGTVPFVDDLEMILRDKTKRKKLTENWNRTIMESKGEWK